MENGKVIKPIVREWRVIEIEPDSNGTFVYTFEHIDQNRNKLLQIKMRLGPGPSKLNKGDLVSIEANIKIFRDENSI